MGLKQCQRKWQEFFMVQETFRRRQTHLTGKDLESSVCKTAGSVCWKLLRKSVWEAGGTGPHFPGSALKHLSPTFPIWVPIWASSSAVLNFPHLCALCSLLTFLWVEGQSGRVRLEREQEWGLRVIYHGMCSIKGSWTSPISQLHLLDRPQAIC